MMRIRLVSWMLAVLSWGVVSARTEEPSQCDPGGGHKRHCLYVSLEGNDRWSGTIPKANAEQSDGPLATLARARDVVRELKRGGGVDRPVRVMLLEGTHRLRQPLVLTGEDGGTAEAAVTYTAFPGHRPVLSGGMCVTGWQPHEGEIVKTRLQKAKPAAQPFRQLFLDGQRQIRARWPNRSSDSPLYDGWAFVDQPLPADAERPVRFRFIADQAPRDWANPKQAEVNIFPWYCWVNDLVPTEEFDRAEKTIELARPVSSAWMTLMAGNRFRVENVLEELDEPGEWCVDTERQVLYFWPPASLEEHNRVVVPISDTLIELRGSAKTPVQHVTICGLRFTETRTTFPGSLHPNFHAPLPDGAAIRLEHSRRCRITGNLFRGLGGDAVHMHGPNEYNEIVGNEIADVGAAGVSLASDAEGNTNTWDDEDVLRERSSQYPLLTKNLVANNHIHHCGVIKKNGGAVHFYGINSAGNTVRHNYIHHTADKGVTMQDGFGPVVVEYNQIHDVGLEIADTGAVMTNRWFPLKNDPQLAGGNVVRFNFIRDVIGCGAYAERRHPQGEGDRVLPGGRIRSPYYTWGIYFDNSGTEITVFGNIVVRAVLGGISMPVGSPRNNRVENNIVIDCSGNQLDLRMGQSARGNRFRRNILYYTTAEAALLAARSTAPRTLAECDFNLYWPAAGQPLRVRGIEGGSFDDWKALGFDAHSLLADPRFVDVDDGDYRLQPSSPAFELGFQPIETARIGLQEPYRTRLTKVAAGDGMGSGER